MTFKSLAELIAAIDADDRNPSQDRYRLHSLSNGTWFAFNPQPAASTKWWTVATYGNIGKALSLNRALNRILQDVRENWVGDELDQAEADKLVQSYKLIKVEVEPC